MFLSNLQERIAYRIDVSIDSDFLLLGESRLVCIVLVLDCCDLTLLLFALLDDPTLRAHLSVPTRRTGRTAASLSRSGEIRLRDDYTLSLFGRSNDRFKTRRPAVGCVDISRDCHLLLRVFATTLTGASRPNAFVGRWSVRFLFDGGRFTFSVIGRGASRLLKATDWISKKLNTPSSSVYHS